MIHKVRGTQDISPACFTDKPDAQIKRLKKSLAVANNLAARYALIVGEDEIQSGSYRLRDMITGEQQKLEESELINILKQ
jgi:histidyl-tRNA synthetase